jgi:L-threonylcarbamoyladenylate synthase
LCYTVVKGTIIKYNAMAVKLSTDIRQQVAKGIAILQQGGVVAFPTDTIYGLGASAYIVKAVERIYAIKERPGNMALPLLLANVSQIKEVAIDIPPLTWKLA